MKSEASDKKYLLWRHDGWQYHRRVPARYAHVDDRKFIRATLRTAELSVARRLRDLRVLADDEYWAVLDAEAASADGLSKAAFEVVDRRYKAACARAVAMGFGYSLASDLAESASTDEILDRIRVLESQGATLETPPRASDTQAILGGVEEPENPIKVSEAFELFVEKIAFDDQFNKSPAQRKSWEKTKRTSINYFIGEMGDLKLTEITRDIALEYGDWWMARMQPEDEAVKPVTPNTANRHIGNMRSLYERYFKYVGDKSRENPFADMYFTGKSEAKRAPFSDDFVRINVLQPGMFDGLRLDLRVILFLLIETGARMSEICNLGADDIRLNANVPHIVIRPEQKRELKTIVSKREVPLVGIAHIAMKACPEGFPHYYDKSTLVSANLMKAFRKRNLLPTSDHVIYSFRHSFEDRMLEAGLDYGLRCALMGHKNDRPEYGTGGSLEYRRDELLKIAHPFDPKIFASFEGGGVAASAYAAPAGSAT